MSWIIELNSANFLSPYNQPSMHALSFTKADLFWAAITVGRPNLSAVLQHGHWSIYEALFRCNLVLANLDFSSRHLSYSPAFRALDGTEKAGVNFFLGMIFAKLVAEKQLGVPWLHHFDNFCIANSVVKLPGNSRPDFVGFRPQDHSWHILEAKARVDRFRSTVLQKAKAQARQVQTVDGHSPATAIGALLSPSNGVLRFNWEDPEPVKEGGIELQETAKVWQSYYRLPLALAQLEEREKTAFATIVGFEVSISDKILASVKSIVNETGEWRMHRDMIINRSTELKDRNPDDPSSPLGDGVIITQTGARD